MAGERPIESAQTLAPGDEGGGTSDSWQGHVIDGRYRIVQPLGEGGMGAVFVAEHLTLQKQVALKTIHASFAGHPEIAARFAREAMASARVDHPHVVSALDYGMLGDDSAYLVMPLVRGRSLGDALAEQGAVPWRTACQIVEQIADAVGAAHAAGIVHRDLKPDNVVLEPSEGSDVPHVRVLDFGIAHLRSDAAPVQTLTGSAPLTQVGAVIGTPGYMAPEQGVGQAVDERTDLYALGVMLWEMIAGRRPFAGGTLAEIVQQQFADKPPTLPVDRQDDAVPPQLGELVERLLHKDPDQRPEGAYVVRDALRELPHASGRAGIARVLPSGSDLKAKLARLPRSARVALAAMLLWLLLWSLGGDDRQPRGMQDAEAPSVQEAPSQQEEALGEQEEVTASDRTRSKAGVNETTSKKKKGGGSGSGGGGRPRHRIRRAVRSLFR